MCAASDLEMSRKLSAAIIGYLETPNRLKEHKQAAYRHFQSRAFNQDACVARFTWAFPEVRDGLHFVGLISMHCALLRWLTAGLEAAWLIG